MGEMALHLFRGCNLTTRIMTNQHLGSCLATERTRFSYLKICLRLSRFMYIFFSLKFDFSFKVGRAIEAEATGWEQALENFFCKIYELINLWVRIVTNLLIRIQKQRFSRGHLPTPSRYHGNVSWVKKIKLSCQINIFRK